VKLYSIYYVIHTADSRATLYIYIQPSQTRPDHQSILYRYQILEEHYSGARPTEPQYTDRRPPEPHIVQTSGHQSHIIQTSDNQSHIIPTPDQQSHILLFFQDKNNYSVGVIYRHVVDTSIFFPNCTNKTTGTGSKQ
jgi:hypothetical protein